MSLMNKIKVAVIGATGYTGLDLVYILSKHPKVKIIHLCASKSIGKEIFLFDKRIKKKITKNYIISKIKLEIVRRSFSIFTKWRSAKNYKK